MSSGGAEAAQLHQLASSHSLLERRSSEESVQLKDHFVSNLSRLQIGISITLLNQNNTPKIFEKSGEESECLLKIYFYKENIVCIKKCL